MDSLKFTSKNKSTKQSSASNNDGSPSTMTAAATSSTTFPTGIKFNVANDTIEDIHNIIGIGANKLNDATSLQQSKQQQQQQQGNQPTNSSLQQTIEDFNWRKELFQSGFFNKKRSGSIEGSKGGLGILSTSTCPSTTTTSSVLSTSNNQNNQSDIFPSMSTASTLVSNLTSDTNSVGTWKLIKGKVSQAMEDIKSSKSSSQPKEIISSVTNTTGTIQSDGTNSDEIQLTPDNALSCDTINTLTTVLETPPNNSTSSASLATSTAVLTTNATTLQQTIYSLPSLKTQHTKYFGFSRRSNRSDSDTDDDNEASSVVEDFIESTSLRKSFANLKTKAKKNLVGSTSSSGSSSISLSGTSTDLILSTTTNSTQPPNSTPSTTTTVPSSTASTISGIRNTFLRKRNKKQSPDKSSPPTTISTSTSNLSQTATLATISSSLPSGNTVSVTKKSLTQKLQRKISKKDFEIESGVEMLEDMKLMQHNQSGNNTDPLNYNLDDYTIFKNDSAIPYSNEGMKISLSTDTIAFKKTPPTTAGIRHVSQTVPNLQQHELDYSKESSVTMTKCQKTSLNTKQLYSTVKNKNQINNFAIQIQYFITNIVKKSNFLLTVILFLILLLAPLPEFFRGVCFSLFILAFFTTFSEYFCLLLNEKLKNFNFSNIGDTFYSKSLMKNFNKSIGSTGGDGKSLDFGPQKCKFEIPDYSKMGVLEIPIIEEHRPLKLYSGWMNEINNYDPNNFHLSMTRSVYVRLDGSILRILNTSTRIPKRAMWNENPIDRKNIIFTCSRTFNLTNARIEMLPRGLARKRYFSRKYPIQLIIKNYENQLKQFGSDDDGISFNEKTSVIGSNTTKENTGAGTSTQQETNTNSSIVVGNDERVSFHQHSNESNEDSISTGIGYDNKTIDIDFGATLLNYDLQKLHNIQDPIALKETIPCGDETRILLFARCDREKEDWYRRFYAASIGSIHEQDLKIGDMVMITDEEVQQALKAHGTAGLNVTNLNSPAGNDGGDTSKLPGSDSTKSSANEKDSKTSSTANQTSTNIPQSNTNVNTDTNCDNIVPVEDASTFEGLLFSADAARNQPEYIKFMARYQKACCQRKIPVIKASLVPNETPTKRNRRKKRIEDELWKGINQSLYLGPSGSIVWANVLIGRVLFSCLNDSILLEKIQDFLQKKISAIRLPNFMEDVVIAHINLGDTPPLIHRVSQPHLDERGTWLDADITYEGLVHMTITTKLNLLRLKRTSGGGGGGTGSTNTSNINNPNQSPLSTVSTNTQSTNTTNSVTTQTSPNTQQLSQNKIPRPSSASVLSSSAAATSTDKQIQSNNNETSTLSSTSDLTTLQSSSNFFNNENPMKQIDSNSATTSVVNNNFTNNSNNTNNNMNVDTAQPNEQILNNYENFQIDSTSNLTQANQNNDCNSQTSLLINSAIYDSNAESSGGSSTESESPTTGSTFDISSESQSFHPTPGGSRRFLRIVDRIAASNIFQSATEISYIQRAMENMSTKITLQVELKGLVSRIVLNIPPPPSDRIWLAFRGPPRLWISAKPAVGDHAFDWSIVTNVIENKLCDEVYKYLVYPNMVDIIVPFLGQSTYKE